MAAFYQSLDEGTPVPVPVEDAAPIVEWTEKIARAADAEWEATKATITLADSVPVLVTGASGSLGGAVVDRLLAEGSRVRVMLRNLPAHLPDGVEVALGDLGDPAAVDRAVRGAKQVIHVGAAMKGGLIEHTTATIIGTRNVIAACKKHGVEKLVHVSSMSVIDWAGAPAGTAVNERTAFEPRAEDRGAYTQAKLEAEKLVTAAVKEQQLPAVILRPGQIFGSRIPLITGAVARRVAGRWLVLGDGKITLPLIYIDDVVDAILLAAKGELKSGEVIQLVGAEELTQDDVLRIAGAPPRSSTSPPRPLRPRQDQRVCARPPQAKVPSVRVPAQVRAGQAALREPQRRPPAPLDGAHQRRRGHPAHRRRQHRARRRQVTHPRSRAILAPQDRSSI